MKRCYILVFVALLLGCQKPQPPPTPKERMLAAANEIVSNPNAWNTNSKHFADFVRASIEVHWDEISEVKDFKASVVDLTVFGTQWVETLDSGQRRQLTERLQTVATDVRVAAPIGGVPPAASAQTRSQTNEQQVADYLATTTGQLTKEQGEQFGRLYKKLIDAYERFYKRAISQGA